MPAGQSARCRVPSPTFWKSAAKYNSSPRTWTTAVGAHLFPGSASNWNPETVGCRPFRSSGKSLSLSRTVCSKQLEYSASICRFETLSDKIEESMVCGPAFQFYVLWLKFIYIERHTLAIIMFHISEREFSVSIRIWSPGYPFTSRDIWTQQLFLLNHWLLLLGCEVNLSN